MSWGSTSSGRIQKLQVKQNHAVRLIFFATTYGKETQSAKPYLSLIADAASEPEASEQGSKSNLQTRSLTDFDFNHNALCCVFKYFIYDPISVPP